MLSKKQKNNFPLYIFAFQIKKNSKNNFLSFWDFILMKGSSCTSYNSCYNILNSTFIFFCRDECVCNNQTNDSFPIFFKHSMIVSLTLLCRDRIPPKFFCSKSTSMKPSVRSIASKKCSFSFFFWDDIYSTISIYQEIYAVSFLFQSIEIYFIKVEEDISGAIFLNYLKAFWETQYNFI